MKKYVIYFLLFLVSWTKFSSLSFGQSDESFQELMRLLQTYTDEHVVPLMQIQRSKLDSFLSPRDLGKAEELKIEYLKLLKRKQNLLNNFEGSDKAWLKEYDYIQNVEADIFLEVNILTNKYQSILDKLLEEEVADYINIWRNDMNEIVHQYNTQTSTGQAWPFKKHGLGAFMRPEGFILWKIDASPSFDRDAAAETGLSHTQVLRNSRPIEFIVKEAGEVTISLLNKQGKVIRTVFKDFLEVGSHRFHLPQLNHVFSAHYFKIESKSGTEIQKYPSN